MLAFIRQKNTVFPNLNQFLPQKAIESNADLWARIPNSAFPLSRVNPSDTLPTFRRFELGASGLGPAAATLLPLIVELSTETR